MSCSALNRIPEHCQLYLLGNGIAAVGITIFVIGIIAQCNVGALQGVNSITSISLITVGSTTIVLEITICVLWSVKKSTPLSYFDYNRLKQHIHFHEHVCYYADGNPNQVFAAYYGSGGLQEGRNPVDFDKTKTLTLRDLQKRAGEDANSSVWTFFCGD